MLSNSWLRTSVICIPPTDKTANTAKIKEKMNIVSNGSDVSDPLIHSTGDEIYRAMSSAIEAIAEFYDSSLEVERVFRDEIRRLDDLVIEGKVDSGTLCRINEWREGWLRLIRIQRSKHSLNGRAL